METPQGFSDIIESWLSQIPGLRTYRGREHRRETDKRLREHLASRLHEARSLLTGLVRDLQKAGLLEPLDELDRVSSQVQQMADTIRYASHGYSGMFAVEKIREEQLEKLYAFDLSLMDDLDSILSTVNKMREKNSPETLSALIGEAEKLLGDLKQKFLQRKDFLDRPA
jgi:hypothetical protein